MTTGLAEIERSQHLPTRVAGKIRDLIEAGRLAAGGKLPTEHALAGTFKVSRSVVREAIAQLRSEGMVETRQGVGAFATDPARRATIRIGEASLAEPNNLRDFFHLRLPLEIESARLAALRRTPDDVAALQRALDAMTGTADWLGEGVKADLDFHRALAAATRNEYYVIFLGFIAGKISATIDAASSRATKAEIVAVTIAEHAAIHAAVAAGDPLRAASAMRDHIVNAAARVRIDLQTT